MWLALILTAVFIFYGSVYPFDYQNVPLTSDLFEVFLQSWQQRSSRGDVFGNVVLFVPFGGIGMLAGTRPSGGWLKVSLVAGSGLMLALISQFAQFYVPSRIPAIEDVMWNMLGLLIGLGLGATTAGFLRRWQHRAKVSEIDPMPLILIGLWLVARLLPLVPTVDLQAYKNSLKPLLVDPLFTATSFLIGVAGWLAVALLVVEIRGPRRAGLMLLALGGATLALEVIIVDNWVSLSNVLALGLAVLLMMTIIRWVPNPALIALAAIVLALAYSGLEPFRLSDEINTFKWIPFEALLNGDPLNSARVFVAKMFFYSALIWFLDRLRLGSYLCVIGTATALVAGIEVGQLFFTAHTPEITDPIVVLLCAAIIFSIRRHPAVVAGKLV